ncbi:MAG TPA: glucokinase [Candidatus Limnocylindria bacterium]|nr:glucokinase [Candidatus Limnocylindria bacterium]
MSRVADASVVLAADVGGTKTRFGLFRTDGDALHAVYEQRVPSDRQVGFAELMQRFLSARPDAPPRAACFAVAGPVLGERVAMTNHPWVLDARELSAAAGGVPVRIVNDLAATAVAMPFLPASSLVPLAPPPTPAPRGHVAVVGPGTGLGCATLYWDGARHHPLASEGGHGDFAPRTEREVALWHYLRERHEHVSWERVLSGPGIVTIYEFLRDACGIAESAAVRADLATAPDRAARISRAALEEGDGLASATLDLFASVLGAKAGNLALDVLALGGVFIAGGIPPKILPALTRGTLYDAFVAKGRQRELMARMPLQISLEPAAALLGAARLASAALG